MEKIDGIIKSIGIILAYAGIAIFGAIAHSTKLAMTAKEIQKDFTKTDFILNAILSCFSATMFGIGVSYLTSNVWIILFSIGVGGITGIKGMEKISDAFLDMATNYITSRKNDR